MIEVIEPGLQTTVQDLGRPGWAHLGVPEGGAADPWSLAVANALVGNPPEAACLEISVAGPRLRALEDVDVAIAGADLRATAAGDRVLPGRRVRLRAGSELVFSSRLAGGGARAYVAVAGGMDVPMVLDSRSTYLAARFGGLEGRPLQAGDRLLRGPRRDGVEAVPPADTWPGEPIAPRQTDADGTTVIRLLPGPAAVTLEGMRWTVGTDSDRMGLRLDREEGPSLPAREGLPSHGVTRGTVQLPPDGRPIVLHADHQPTGGYPVAGVVVTADLAALGQLAPGDRLRFEPVELGTARSLLLDQRAAWQAAIRLLHGDAGWEELWRTAGG